MNKILITGGAGFIGSALIKRLQQEDSQIYVLDNLSFGNRDFIDIPESHFYLVDIRSKAEVNNVFRLVQPDTVIHLAAVHFIPYCNKHPYEASDVNITGTMNVLDTIKKTSSIDRLFFASTAAIYPIYDKAIHEEVESGPLDIYGLSKLVGEDLCEKFYLETNIPTIVCRFFNAFGPNETNPHLIPEIQQQIKEGKREISLGNLEPKRDFIHTSDMAEAILLLLSQFEEGFNIFNLGRGIEYSVKEIVEAFEEALGEDIKIIQDPSRQRKSDRMHLLAKNDKLKNFTGWSPKVGIVEGIKTLLHE